MKYTQLIRNAFYKRATRFQKLLQRLFNCSTVGVRAIILDKKENILLVKHTYRPGWYLPGGGVDTGETIWSALARELKEEVGIILGENKPVIFGLYHQMYMGVNDYPILFVVTDFSTIDSACPEIEEKRWFSLHALPPSTTLGTKIRVKEFLNQSTKAEVW